MIKTILTATTETASWSDFSNIATLIIALVAIVSPILTALINNLYQFKLRKLEIEQKNQEYIYNKKKEALSNYLSSMSRVVNNSTLENIDEYALSYPIALLYVDNESSILMIEIDKLINEYEWTASHLLLDKITLRIKEQLGSM